MSKNKQKKNAKKQKMNAKMKQKKNAKKKMMNVKKLNMKKLNVKKLKRMPQRENTMMNMKKK